MRTISAASLARISANAGTEPSIIVKVYWNGNPTSYADKKVDQEGLLGQLLSVSGIDDVVDLNSSASSAAITITLDDTDGELKNIWNNTDIHKTRVQVLQWFKDVPLNDAFVIFDGVISSPIIWSEGARTLQFEVITQLEDREVGFSVEEGVFPYVAADLIGQPWPIVFGTVAKHKPLKLNDDASMVLASGFAVIDHNIWAAEFANLQTSITETQQQAAVANQLAAENYVKAGHYRSDFFGQRDLALADQYQNAADSYFAQVADYTQRYIELLFEFAQLQEEYEQQKAYEWSEIVYIPVVHANLPTTEIAVNGRIGEYLFTGRFYGINNGVLMLQTVTRITPTETNPAVNSISLLGSQTQYRYTPQGQKFTWIDGGTVVDIWNYPTYHIVSLGACTVLNVWAKNKYGKAVVPQAWYRTEFISFGSTGLTRLVFDRAISTYEGSWDISDFRVDCVNTGFGNNVVEIMVWAIQNYSNFDYDVPSFTAARNSVDGMRANFVLYQRMNTHEFLRELAFQSRCAVWLNDNKFYLRYLPDEPTPVDTITTSDIEVNSLTLSSVDTEKLVTKFVANWQASGDQNTPNKVILRYNIEKYGTHEESYDFFIYNQYDFVAKAAEFWMVRKANSYKILRCKLFLNKLRIEAFDPVTFDLDAGLVANGPVTGIVQKAIYDPSSNSIDLEAWIPVRLGEMEKYDFAFLGSTTNIYPDDSDPFIRTGNPLEEVNNDFVPALQLSTQRLAVSRGRPWQRGTGLAGNVDPTPDDFIVVLDQNEVNQARPAFLPTANKTLKVEVKPVTEVVIPDPTSNGYYGEIIGFISGDRYSCNVWLDGLDLDPTVKTVRIGFIPEDEEIPQGYPVNVYKTTFKTTLSGEEVVVPEFWAQPPMWMANP